MASFPLYPMVFSFNQNLEERKFCTSMSSGRVEKNQKSVPRIDGNYLSP